MQGARFSPWRAAPLLLMLAVLFWAGNSIAGRALAGDVSPFTLAFWRWVTAVLLVTPFAWRGLRTDAKELLRRWKMVVALSVTGVASFGVLLYIGLQTTTALNSVLVQSAIPPLVLLAAWLAYGERPGLGQTLGVGVSLLGVVVVITSGRPWDLRHTGLNQGDAIILVGVGLYAVYSLLLRRRPAVAPLSLLWATFAAAVLLTAPAYVATLALGDRRPLTWEVMAGVAYVAAFPSFLAYLFYNRGAELIGAARASQFMHLQPIFGALLAILMLGEPFRAFHAVGVGLIAAGIGLSAWTARRTSA